MKFSRSSKKFSAEILLDIFQKNKAELINQYWILVNSPQVQHFTDPCIHDFRTKLKVLKDFQKYVQYKKYKYLVNQKMCVVSTTFGKMSSSNECYKFSAVPAFDIEYPYKKFGLVILRKACRILKTKMDIFYTENGLHVIVLDEIFKDDIKFWNRLADFIQVTAEILNHKWICEFVSKIRDSKNFSEIQKVCYEILKKVGHLGEGELPSTYIDLRHLAHGALSNDRLRGKEKLHIKNGIRTQLFFRVTPKHEGGNIPYFITSIDEDRKTNL
jgi:hypothetical protein